jgi:hypothetical protein
MSFELADADKASDLEKVRRADAFEAAIRKELPSDIVWLCDQITTRVKRVGSQLGEVGQAFINWLDEQEFEPRGPFRDMLSGTAQDARELVNDTVAWNQVFLTVALPYAIPTEFEEINWMESMEEMEHLLAEFKCT